MVNIHSSISAVERSLHRLGLARFSGYIEAMTKGTFALAAAALAVTAAPASAGASGFTVINATGAGLSSLAIRRTGTDNWQPLSAAPAVGAASSVAFSDPDCAFDLKGDGRRQRHGDLERHQSVRDEPADLAAAPFRRNLGRLRLSGRRGRGRTGARGHR
jgi:hypothetical protein